MVQTLTLVLTVVTALGAIWAALAGTSQARASSAQARIAERGLEEQIRSFREQNELARDANERARLSFEVDMMIKLEDQWHSPTVLARRTKAANQAKAHFFTDDGGLEVQHIDENTRSDAVYLINFFDRLGALVSQGVLRAETVWQRFGVSVRTYWALYRPSMEKLREEQKDPTLAEDFEGLDILMADLDRQHGVGEEYFTNQQLRLFVESESNILTNEETHSRDREEE